MSTLTKEIKKVDHVVVRFAGDSGDGMQLTGNQFTTATAVVGNDLITLPARIGQLGQLGQAGPAEQDVMAQVVALDEADGGLGHVPVGPQALEDFGVIGLRFWTMTP